MLQNRPTTDPIEDVELKTFEQWTFELSDSKDRVSKQSKCQVETKNRLFENLNNSKHSRTIKRSRPSIWTENTG